MYRPLCWILGLFPVAASPLPESHSWPLYPPPCSLLSQEIYPASCQLPGLPWAPDEGGPEDTDLWMPYLPDQEASALFLGLVEVSQKSEKRSSSARRAGEGNTFAMGRVEVLQKPVNISAPARQAGADSALATGLFLCPAEADGRGTPSRFCKKPAVFVDLCTTSIPPEKVFPPRSAVLFLFCLVAKGKKKARKSIPCAKQARLPLPPCLKQPDRQTKPLSVPPSPPSPSGFPSQWVAGIALIFSFFLAVEVIRLAYHRTERRCARSRRKSNTQQAGRPRAAGQAQEA